MEMRWNTSLDMSIPTSQTSTSEPLTPARAMIERSPKLLRRDMSALGISVNCQLTIKTECPSVPVCVTLDICDKQAEKANQAMQCNANVDIKLVDNKSIIISPTFYLFLVVGLVDDD